MINLIPPSAKKDLKREYWVRVIAVWLLLWSVFLVVGACLLFPVYVLIGSQVAVYKDSAEEASQRVTSYENVTTTLVQTSLQAKFVLDEIAVPVFSEQIELFETLEGSEIKINKIYIGRGADGIAPISLSGIASGRQALASFRDRILNLENVEDVDLPISNLAQDKNIPFTIKVTLINQKRGMSKSTKNIVLISIIIFVASAVSLGVMAYQVKEQGNQLSSHVATLQAESAQVESYNKLKKISEETTEDRDLLQSYFLEKESNSIDFLNLVESLAPQAGVQLDTEGLDVLETGENGAKWIEVSFVFSASRERVQNFIKVLETLPYVLRLTSVEMDGMSASEWEARVTMQVQILDYDK